MSHLRRCALSRFVEGRKTPHPQTILHNVSTYLFACRDLLFGEVRVEEIKEERKRRTFSIGEDGHSSPRHKMDERCDEMTRPRATRPPV